MSLIEAPEEVTPLEKYKTVVTSGQSALKALLTMNGGATIAFLTFMGHLWDKGTLTPKSVSPFVGALQLFIWGTFAAVLAYGLIFFTNCVSYAGYKKWSNKVANVIFAVTVLAGIASVVCFLLASGSAVHAFQTVPAPVNSVGAPVP